ncbi:hypothetical protein C9409_18735 [Xanthomonas vasicola pv. vasculorum]|nr:hypothetical protein B1H32_16690 [Xanthomonas vasicola pv. vasculorum]RNK58799.1 hypothetical protein C9402_09705 [Xanthomonas vasicola pv. vasculorum]RNK79823.1 hypothetical protein C9392_15290 [Xanthomonas vasicola pv. vasculorum]RNL09728.1 hypothetical protein C9407_01760 [Xanthomonas vasicola pv. vasculorum]RNL14319.1 hypothetical protein C9409_18735 [Xanthomonas vasicola pv. vasculorum]
MRGEGGGASGASRLVGRCLHGRNRIDATQWQKTDRVSEAPALSVVIESTWIQLDAIFDRNVNADPMPIIDRTTSLHC